MYIKGKYIDNNNYRIFDFDLADQIYNDCKNKEGKIKINFVFPDIEQEQEEKIICPICKKGKIIDKDKFFGCSDYNKSRELMQ